MLGTFWNNVQSLISYCREEKGGDQLHVTNEGHVSDT